jgi:hypothetical protein
MAGIVCCLVLVVAAPHLAAEEPVDWQMVNRLRDEGLNRSQVMETLRHLTDIIGPRLTGSPGMREANEWTRDQLAAWGLANAHLEEWGPFGYGWSFTRTAVHLVEPRQVPLMALPLAWTPGTEGPVRGAAMKVEIEEEEDLDDYRGEVAGKILFLDEVRELDPESQVAFDRFTPDELDELEIFKLPGESRSDWMERARKRWRFSQAFNRFLEEEGVLATVRISSRDGGTLRLGRGGSRHSGDSVGVVSIAMMAEQYNWIVRLLDEEIPVEVEIDVEARFHTDEPMAYNTIAEIPGTDLRDEIVMVGGHLDSWHAAAGANDNAAGCAVAMEAMRLLQTLGVRPRRTIRIGLWSAEEQGLLGSQSHVEKHYAVQPRTDDPEQQEYPERLRSRAWPIEVEPDHADFSVYFNIDNGGGKIRGIYTRANAAVVPIFEAWLEPLNDLGADTVTGNPNIGGTDHYSFDRVGLPGFQFIQDPLDYFPRTHHSNLDTYDHARREDLMQASVVVASFVYHAAMRDDKLPRKPMPRQPPEDD